MMNHALSMRCVWLLFQTRPIWAMSTTTTGQHSAHSSVDGRDERRSLPRCKNTSRLGRKFGLLGCLESRRLSALTGRLVELVSGCY